MDSLNRKALIAFLILLALDLFVRVWASREPVGPKGVEYLSFDPSQVVTLEISSGKERLVLDRTSQGFERTGSSEMDGRGIPQRLITSTQAAEVEAFIQRICSMVRESIDGTSDSKGTIYGLDSEHSVSVQLQWKGNGKDQKRSTVRFGSVLPLNVMYVYATFDDQPGLFKVVKTYRESAVSLLHRLIQP